MKKMNFTSFLMRLAFAFVLTLTGQMTAMAQEKLDLSITDPSGCSVTLTATTPTITITPALPGPPPVAAVTQAGLGVPAGTVFVVRKVGLELPISGTSATNYEVTTYTFVKADVGQEFLVTFMHPVDGMTSRRVRVYDITGPTISLLNPVSIRCTDALNNKAPFPGAVVKNLGAGTTRMPVPAIGTAAGATNPNSITLAAASSVDYSATQVNFYVNDCHNITWASWSDGPFILTNDCPSASSTPDACTYGTITRTWTFKDKFGNTTTGTQVITIVKPRILFPSGTGIVDPAAATAATNFTTNVTTTVNNITDCGASVGSPFADWNCDGARATDGSEDVASGEVVCGRSITAGPTTRMELCSGSYMLVRTWKYMNCDNTFYTINQTVNVWDAKAPTVSLYYRDYARIPEEQVVCMGAMKIVQYVYATGVDHWQEGFKGFTSVTRTTDPVTGRMITNGNDFNTIQINPLMDLGSCTSASIDVMVGALDPVCSGMTTLRVGSVATGAPSGPSSGSSNIRFNGMESMKINDGERVRMTGNFSALAGATADPFFYLEGIDPCGNITRIKVVVNIIDNITPTSFCEDKDVTLTNTGKAIITGSILTNGTNDNCTTAFEDKITPLDPMKGRILVRRMGSDCWVENFTVDCSDDVVVVQVRVLDMMGNYSDCMVNVKVRDKAGPTCPMSQPVTAVCTNPALANLESFFTQPQAYDNCQVDFLSATAPVANLTCGAGTVTKSWTFRDRQGNTTTCSQTLTITSRVGYRVLPIASELKTCSYTFDKAAEVKAALNNVRLLNSSTESTCSGPTVEVEVWDYASSEYCKIFRIRYTFQDICRQYPVGQALACYVRKEFKDAAGNLLVAAENDATTATPCYTKYTSGTYSGYFQDNAGTFGFERFVYVYDKTKPVSTPPAIAPICVIGNVCSFDFPAITLTGSDQCADGTTINSSVNPSLFFDWSVTTTRGGTSYTTTGQTATVSGDNLKGVDFGTYTVNYSIRDACGNINWYSFTITGKDCKSPYINTHDKNTVLAWNSTNKQGMSMMDLDVPGGTGPLNDVADNCTSLADLLPKMRFVRASDNPTNTYPVNGGKTIMFTCADFKGANPVQTQVWSIDNSGNAVFNIVFIQVQDNVPSACTTPNPQSDVKGTLKTENAQPAKAVTLTASMAGTVMNAPTTTDANGAFSFTVNQGNNYVVKANKLLTDDKYAGVTTFDIARVSKALLDIEPFTSPYQHIAADVDKSGSVDGADMLHIRNFILRKTTSLPAGVWRFIDSKYAFKNPANPFGEDFPEAVNISAAKASETANFTAIKLGDVNATYTANLVSAVVRSNNALTLNVEDRDLVAGNEYTVNVTADNFNAASFQGTFGIANAAIKSVKAGDLKNYSDGNFGIFANEITTSWNGQAKGAAQVFAITFTANKSGKLSEMMTVGSSLTPAVANDAAGSEMNINLKFSTGKVAGGEFALYQNTPNPVAQETSIGFNMPKDGSAKLTIYSVEGKVVMTKNVDAKAGVNQITINKSELAAGVLYYRLETADHSATKKMVVIE